MTDTVSSRIFVKGLPPTLTDVEFRKHFSQNDREVTDSKIFPNRRIGYIGYKTPEEAQKAVKYFNKTFMRMSRIGVEIARPARTGNEQTGGSAPTSRRQSGSRLAEAGTKRKRENETEGQDDTKLKEFMDVMKQKSKKKGWENEVEDIAVPPHEGDVQAVAKGQEDQSDEEYEAVPKKSKRARVEPDAQPRPSSRDASNNDPPEQVDAKKDDSAVEEGQEDEDGSPKPTTSDADWARSKTSRLLGLLDDDEEEESHLAEASVDSDLDEEVAEKGASRGQGSAPESSMPTPPSDDKADEVESEKVVNADIETVRSSMRLFVRNLPYDVKEEDLEAEFASYGNLEEVRRFEFSFTLA